jgi:hypothetical protein
VDVRENIPSKREGWKEIMFKGINVGVEEEKLLSL